MSMSLWLNFKVGRVRNEDTKLLKVFPRFDTEIIRARISGAMVPFHLVSIVLASSCINDDAGGSTSN